MNTATRSASIFARSFEGVCASILIALSFGAPLFVAASHDYSYDHYSYQRPYQHYSEPKCSLSLSYNSSYERGHALLSWSSENATSALIDPEIGSVPTSGSRVVYAPGNQTYRMTVTGSGGTNTCYAYGGSTYSGSYGTPHTNSYPYYGSSETLSCSIRGIPNVGEQGEYILEWDSSERAVSGWLSDGLGHVLPEGTLPVRPGGDRTYVLTVTDSSGRTATCETLVGSLYAVAQPPFISTVASGRPAFLPGGVTQAPIQTPASANYVTLSQIPYTGFDFGPLGNMLYWLALIISAGIGASMILRYKSDAFGMIFGNNLARVHSRHESPRSHTVAPVLPTLPVLTEMRAEMEVHNEKPVPVSQTVQRAPVHAEKPTKDSMSLLQSNGEDMPRIVINRS